MGISRVGMGLSRMGMGTSHVGMGVKHWYLGHGCLSAYSVLVSLGDGAVCRLSECFLSFLLLIYFIWTCIKHYKSARMWKSIHKPDISVHLIFSLLLPPQAVSVFSSKNAGYSMVIGLKHFY